MFGIINNFIYLVLLLRACYIKATEDNFVDFDFQTYTVFKIESTVTGGNSKCVCSKSAEETGYSWNKWSQCQGHAQSFQCHRGIQYRSRTCSDAESIRACKEREWKYCYNELSCTGEWQSWTSAVDGGSCSHSCGGGIRLKVRACVKNNEVGLFCAGKNRSPYDIVMEGCNTQECPKWSEWELHFSNCSKAKSRNEVIIYERSCKYNGKDSLDCEDDKRKERQFVERSCDEAPLSFADKSTGNRDNTSGTYVNTLTIVLFAVIAVLILSIIFIAYLCVKGRKRKSVNRSDSFRREGTVISHSFIQSKKKSSALPLPQEQSSPQSKWKIPEGYEEIKIAPTEPIHGSFTMPVLAKSATAMALPIIPSPLRESFTDLSTDIEQTATYTSMGGSSPVYSEDTFRSGQRLRQFSSNSPQSNVPSTSDSNFYISDHPLPPPPPPPGPMLERQCSSLNHDYPVTGTLTDEEENHVYLESNTMNHEEKRTTNERRLKSRKSEEYNFTEGRKEKGHQAESSISRESSFGFSKLRSGNGNLTEAKLTPQSHLYAEIHDKF